MNARVIFTNKILKQTGSVGKILMFIQDHPVQTRNTNVKTLSETMARSGVMNAVTASQVINKMLKNQMLERYNGKRRCTFVINYLHRDIPGYIIDRADSQTKEKVNEWRASIKEGQRLAEDGCIVTEGKSKKEEEDTITANEENEPSNLPVEVEKKEEVAIPFSSDMSEEKTASVPIKIEDSERGLSISITLNLNINK